MAKASPPRAGDRLAGIAAVTAEVNIAAKLALADVPLKATLAEPLIPDEDDDVTRLILDRHEAIARRDSAVSWPTPKFTNPSLRDHMTLDDIIHELRTSTGVPTEALRAGAAEVECLRPRIVELAQKLIDGVWLIPDDAQLLLRGFHVLAAAKDTQSWPILRDILMLREEDIRHFLGGGAAEGSARLVLSLWDGDGGGLMDLTADPDVSWQVRWGLFQALARLACDGRIDRAEVKGLLESVERERLMPDDSIGWMGWEDAVAHLGLNDMRAVLEHVWATRCVFSDHRDVDREETLRILAAAAERPNDPHELEQDRIMAIDDPVEAVEWLERQIAIAFETISARSGAMAARHQCSTAKSKRRSSSTC